MNICVEFVGPWATQRTSVHTSRICVSTASRTCKTLH